MTVFEIHIIMILPAILFWHFIELFVDSNSRYQKKKFKKSLECVFDHLASMTKAGDRYPTLKVTYKNREFNIGIYKKEHNYRYVTYEIFINGDEAGIYHQIGDCCTQQYYFEKQNNREQYEVMEIIHAGAKEVKKLNRATTEKKDSWNEYSYFK